MELRHEFTVPATLEETWDAFNDIESVAECFPGATVSSVEGDSFVGICKVKLGPISLVYNGSGTFVEKDESARRMVIDAKGNVLEQIGWHKAGVIDAVIPPAAPTATPFARFGNVIPVLMGLLLVIGGIVLGRRRR